MSADEQARQYAKMLLAILDGAEWEGRNHKDDPNWITCSCATHDPLMFSRWNIRLKPWELGRTVNGHTLPDGAEWHRIDGWTEGMLPADPPHRPLMVGEKPLCDDEAKIDNYAQAQWQIITSGHPSGKCLENYHYRTTRPISFTLTNEQIADGWLPWSGGECPVEPESRPTVMFRDGCTDEGPAKQWYWRTVREMHCDIVAYKPDPYAYRDSYTASH